MVRAMADSLSPILNESVWHFGFGPRVSRRVVKKFDPESCGSLSAVFVADERKAYLGLLTGARHVLPTGEVVEVIHRKTPFYDLCRKLDALGYGDRRIEISTPKGTPSMRGVVRVLAGLTVKERDRSGLKLERFEKFHGLAQERDEVVEPIRASKTAPLHCTDSPRGIVAGASK